MAGGERRALIAAERKADIQTLAGAVGRKLETIRI
jgi:hypothetical protein